MKIADQLSDKQKQQLEKMKSPKMKKKKKQEKVNWYEMMDQNKRGLHRRKGGAWG